MHHFLQINLDGYGLCWTRLTNSRADIIALQELPSALRRRVSRLFYKWHEAKYEEIIYNTANTIPFTVDAIPRSAKQLCMRKSQIETLQLINWWINYNEKRKHALQALVYPPHSGTWYCSDCHEIVEAKRIACFNHNCPSWDKLFKCTGDPVFHPGPKPSNT
jgi:hypothetical protein